MEGVTPSPAPPPAIAQRAVRAKFVGSGLVYQDSLTSRGALALVPETLMEKKAPLDVVSMWLDGKVHPKIGILGPPPSWLESRFQAPFTGKRSRAWQQTEPWNREKNGAGGTKVLDLSHAGDFWDWLDSSAAGATHVPDDITTLSLLGGDYAAIGDVSSLSEIRVPPDFEFGLPVLPPISKAISLAPGSRSWVASKTAASASAPSPSQDESYFYQRLLASIILPVEGSSGSHASSSGANQFVPDSQLVQSQGAMVPNLGRRKRTLIELGTAGLLRETDGDGDWLALDESVSRSDGDSEVCREIRKDVQLLKRQEQVCNFHIARLRKRVERNQATVTFTRDDAATQARIMQWQKLQRKKAIALQKRFEASLGLDSSE